MRVTAVIAGELWVNSEQQIITEVCARAATFPSQKNLSSRVGICPGDEESAGISHSHRSSKGNRRILNQAAHAAVKGQRKPSSKLCIALGSAAWICTSHRRHCPPALPADLDHSAPWDLVRGTGASGQQKLKADTHCEDDPRTPTPRLSDRTAECSSGQSSIARGTFNSDFRLLGAPKKSPARGGAFEKRME